MNTISTSKLNIDLSSELNEPQKEAVVYGEGPLLILAGAGSGKTRVITYRIAYLLQRGVKQWNILAVTFTNKAAAEMRERVLQLTQGQGTQIRISTFHSFCANFLRMESQRIGQESQLKGFNSSFAIYDEDDQKKVLKECLHELNLDEKKIKCGALVARISREKDRLIDSESFAISAMASGDPNQEMLAAVYSLYQKKLELSGALDFGDLILKTVELLNTYPQLKEKYQERFHYILVDEYQDTNRAQYILTKIFAGKHKNICVVGDDDQAIYSWRGADIHNLLDFEKDYPNVKVVKLEQNYRSTQPILTAAWKLVQNNQMRKEKKLWTAHESTTPVEFQQLDNEIEEAEWIAQTIAEIRNKTDNALSHFAIFYRTNAQSRVMEDAMRRHQLPYLLVGNVRFYERAEVKDVLAYLKVVANPQDNLSLKRIINCPHRGIGKTSLETMEKYAAEKSLSLFQILENEHLLKILPPRARENVSQFKKMLDEWISKRGQIPVAVLVREILDKTKMLELLKESAKTDLESATRLDNVQELMNATKEFEERNEDKTVIAYLEQVSLLTDIDTWNNRKDGVTLMTVHIAKGLEFPVVFLTGMEEGLFPLGEAQFDQEDLEEERRLAYVGMTRAKDRLFLTAAASRRVFGQTRWNLPSRFVKEAGLMTGGEALSSFRAGDETLRGHSAGALREADLEGDSFFPSGTDPSGRSDAIRIRNAPTESSERTCKTEYEIHSPKLADVYKPQTSEYQRDHSRFRIGERVHHPDFGNGKIIQKSGANDDLKVVVMFDSGEWKKLLVKYAPLRKI